MWARFYIPEHIELSQLIHEGVEVGGGNGGAQAGDGAVALLWRGKELGRGDHSNHRKVPEIVTIERQQMRDTVNEHCSHEPRVMNTPTDNTLGRDKLQPMREEIRSIIEQWHLGLKPLNFLPNGFH